MSERVDPAFGHWLAGFIDGEGHFGMVRRYAERGVVRHGASSRPHFQITLRDDDLATLEQLRDRLGIGRIKRKTAGPFPSQGVYPSKPTATWHVDRKRDLAVLVAVLDAHPLRAKKRRDYAIWREAVRVHARLYRGVRGPRQLSVEHRLAELFQQLRAVRAYAPNGSPAPALDEPEPETQTTLDDLWGRDGR